MAGGPGGNPPPGMQRQGQPPQGNFPPQNQNRGGNPPPMGNNQGRPQG